MRQFIKPVMWSHLYEFQIWIWKVRNGAFLERFFVLLMSYGF